MKISVKVPATTANIGPGFDCFGMALSMYNTVTLEETVYPLDGLEINIMGDQGEALSQYTVPTDKTNIVYKAVELFYNYIGQTPPALRINISTNIPIAKGLGSSASVIVGGIIAANELLGNPADKDAILSIANEIEGHPDNIVPAMMGGFAISSAEEDGSIIYKQVEWPEEWRTTICIPDTELSTQISRSVLPEAISHKDAAFNAKRCAMFIESLYSKDADLMKYALNDRLHQPYRSRLVPGFEDIKKGLSNIDNVIGTVISGAGPSILVISHNNSIEEIKGVIKEIWENQGVKGTLKTLDPDFEGAQIL